MISTGVSSPSFLWMLSSGTPDPLNRTLLFTLSSCLVHVGLALVVLSPVNFLLSRVPEAASLQAFLGNRLKVASADLLKMAFENSVSSSFAPLPSNPSESNNTFY